MQISCLRMFQHIKLSGPVGGGGRGGVGVASFPFSTPSSCWGVETGNEAKWGEGYKQQRYNIILLKRSPECTYVHTPLQRVASTGSSSPQSCHWGTGAEFAQCHCRTRFPERWGPARDQIWQLLHLLYIYKKETRRWIIRTCYARAYLMTTCELLAHHTGNTSTGTGFPASLTPLEIYHRPGF